MSDLHLADATLPGRPGRWDIHCAEGVITAVEPHRDAGGHRVDGKLVVPAYADVHLHLDKAFSGARSPNRSGTLDEAIRLSGQLKRHADEAEVSERVRRGARMALAHGTTRMRVHVDVDPVVGLTHVRGVLRARRGLTAPQMQVVAFPQEGLHAAAADETVTLLREAMALGCDVVGGIPARDGDPGAHIRTVLDLAAEFDAPADLHIDESDDPRDASLELLAAETLRRGWSGRVTASHCCSLAAQSPARRAAIIPQVADAGVHVVTLPSTNLYLQGRADDVRVRRGLAPVKELLAAGVNVAYGSDNIRDPFNPFGNADMSQLGWLLAHAAHMGGIDELAQVHAMGTTRAAAVLESRREPRSDAISPGAPAELAVFDVSTPAEIVVGQHKPRTVVAGGRIAVERHETTTLTTSG